MERHKMQRFFDEELKALNQKILKMALLTQESIHKSIDALKERNAELAGKVITDDAQIDFLENSIDDDVFNMIALHQPVASDLRFLMTALKVNADLERIADLAVDIAQRVVELVGQPLLKPLIDIPKLSAVAQKMIKDVIDAYINKDVALARQVCLSDTEADKLRDLIQNKLINDYMAKDPKSATRAVPLLLIARYLERICDHATNIAEDVIYMVEAKVVKHHHEKLKGEEGARE
ncbi:phosphate transport system regulatory protein PhoU [Candidatus Velamenicoccus archaeovorus]|uniref:Phosphate-specific transport system accessory protein PhoU n=2 Tax=Velamenicoccus archaeovorus TaxID=1930593 RepID=A0A410P5G7_VELA1|nr:phosphate transport system regulatory protein PhoU [Candidatus Velamenicoccus archaeovorus]